MAKWFCDFSLTEKIPDYSVFGRLRSKIGMERSSKIFVLFRDQLREQGYISEVVTFVDASHLIAKASLWEERDEARKKKYEKLNNKVLLEVVYDKQAKIGCKGVNKFWYGYKKHMCVDMQSGLIKKVEVTFANVTDAKDLKHILPKKEAVCSDKGYCTTEQPKVAARAKSIHLCAIKKKNMTEKTLILINITLKSAPHMNEFLPTIINGFVMLVLLKNNLLNL